MIYSLFRSASLTTIITVIQIACSPKNNTSAPKKDKQQAAPNENQSNNGEKIDVPANITGSFLTCIPLNTGETTLATEYGCRLSDSGDGKKIVIDEKRVIWTSNFEEYLSVFPQPMMSPYHVVYQYNVSDQEQLRNLSESAEAIVNWSLENGDKLVIKRKRIIDSIRPDVFIDAIEVPIVRDQSIQPD